MFKTFKNAFKIKEIRKKIFYVFMMLVVIRFGSQLPVPGVNTAFFADFFKNNGNEAFSFLNAFTGGGFDNFSIFALSITPYISIRPEHHPIYYIFYHYPASDNCDSEPRRDAERWRRRKKKDNSTHTLCYRRPCFV